jgi:hypothetical protein
MEEINEDVDVVFNYLRVRGADVIKNTMKLVEQD